ncbi:hypothetical protein Tco_0716885 [Tanacetum coccineum]
MRLTNPLLKTGYNKHLQALSCQKDKLVRSISPSITGLSSKSAEVFSSSLVLSFAQCIESDRKGLFDFGGKGLRKINNVICFKIGAGVCEIKRIPACKVRPRSEEEIAAGIIKDVLNVNKSMCGKENSKKMDTDSFIEVGKKNELVGRQNFGKQNGYYNRYNFSSSQSRGFQTYNRINGSSGRINFASRGPNQLDHNGSAGGRNQSNGWKVKGIDKSIGLKKGNDNVMSDVVSFKKNFLNQHDVKSGNVLKPSLMSKYNAYFQPNVLVTRSGSSMQVNVKGKNVPVSDSFQALEDQDMVDKEECFLSSVDEEFKSGV